jgi:hypothetical protein
MKKIIKVLYINSYRIVAYVWGVYFIFSTVYFILFSKNYEFPKIMAYILFLLTGVYIGYFFALNAIKYLKENK